MPRAEQDSATVANDPLSNCEDAMGTDPIALYVRATDVFDARVRAVRPDQWGNATPCTEWNVRQLVNHVAVEDLWVPPLLAGKTIADVGNAYDGDQLGDEPVAGWSRALAAARQAVLEPGVASRTVHLSYGDDRAGEYLLQLFADHLIHGWDLARAVDGDTDLPGDLVEECIMYFARMEETYRNAGMIAARVDVPATADAQTRLLAAFGRSTSALP
ncbi:MAG TPA: TIGR03086 family metal-binding protein [Jiangellales bacterium]|nr:TIGR03086 family metal-binding protein [Jiangellales bacterium]